MKLKKVLKLSKRKTIITVILFLVLFSFTVYTTYLEFEAHDSVCAAIGGCDLKELTFFTFLSEKPIGEIMSLMLNYKLTNFLFILTFIVPIFYYLVHPYYLYKKE